MPDPLEMVAALGRRLQEKATALGLEMQTFIPMPNLDGGKHVIQAVFTVNPPDKPVNDIDAELADMLAAPAEDALLQALEADAAQAKMDAAREQAIEREKRRQARRRTNG